MPPTMSSTPVFDAVVERWRIQHNGTVPWREDAAPIPFKRRSPATRAQVQQARARARRRI